jgi:hypothetical protein
MNSKILYGIVIDEIAKDGARTSRESMVIDRNELLELYDSIPDKRIPGLRREAPSLRFAWMISRMLNLNIEGEVVS